ncbi:PREDICTED: pre-mRNA-splicing factor ATP-dependent RNA helicase [Prunus dulcis]|uniref:PREDICTED: pre-mRNA-splicing factor ATP-dependent RNA helicase n=1 Tax=Prunus dulcis TaxID=3755 RepID=A0A5E4E9G8_PRUDU|nr:hypothetical protein L3X38_007221 [Prunus dulcis]VVA11926.1 PREDICTED: pre-mRNA-splicing factor ATP-dependent RNA helicase [Prunus dulcis]
MACVSAVSGFREDGSEDEREVLEIEVNEKREERGEGSTLPQAGERKKEDAPGKTGERREDALVKTLYSSPASRSTMRR